MAQSEPKRKIPRLDRWELGMLRADPFHSTYTVKDENSGKLPLKKKPFYFLTYNNGLLACPKKWTG